ncbi:unnamed protein product [Rotaria sp. Silwood1]|nr:unnamed protein product [Rotaria sp. Silwood1]
MPELMTDEKPKSSEQIDLEEAENALSGKDYQTARELLEKLVKLEAKVDDEESIRIKESAILSLGKVFKETKDAKALASLTKTTRPFLGLVSKAKAAKLVRTLVDLFLDMEAGTGEEVTLCQENIEWAKSENRTFLRQDLEARLVALYYDTKKYNEALILGSQLLKELKKLDDKQLLVEVQLLESKTYFALSNIQKARAALTSARTTANGIYTPPKLQASLDLQSGILHAAEDKDFKTAFSYFYEAFEGYDQINNSKGVTALKYMLLSKVMMNTPDDVNALMSVKLALKYSGRDVEAMKAIAQASKKRSLADFQQALKDYKTELSDDPVVHSHLGTLYDNLLEQNLSRLLEPFSNVQIEHIARLIDLPRDVVEKKLSQMILDKKLSGILDQGSSNIVIFDETPTDTQYQDALVIIQNITEALVTAFDEDNQPHPHRSVFYYTYTNQTLSGRLHGQERHDHFGYCYGWALNEPSCTILITDNVYIVARNLCCLAMPGNFGVPIHWLRGATWLGIEQIHGRTVDHWYSHEHEYWSEVDEPRNGVRYSGPNFKTPRQFTDYDAWQIGPQDPRLFDLPENTDCNQSCP